MMIYLLLLPLVLVGVQGTKGFNMCCSIKAFNVEPCMIKDGRVLENFSSKDKIADFPITNGKLNIRMSLSY